MRVSGSGFLDPDPDPHIMRVRKPSTLTLTLRVPAGHRVASDPQADERQTTTTLRDSRDGERQRDGERWRGEEAEDGRTEVRWRGEEVEGRRQIANQVMERRRREEAKAKMQRRRGRGEHADAKRQRNDSRVMDKEIVGWTERLPDGEAKRQRQEEGVREKETLGFLCVWLALCVSIVYHSQNTTFFGSGPVELKKRLSRPSILRVGSGRVGRVPDPLIRSRSGTGPDSKTDQQAPDQTGETSAEPCLQQKSAENPESGTRSGTEAAPATISEQGSPHNQAEERLVLRTWKHQKSHPLDQILTDLNSGVQTRSRTKNFCAFHAFISLLEPKNVHEALTDSDWIMAMQDELHQFEKKSGGTSAEPWLEQRTAVSPESRTRTGTEAEPAAVFEPGSPNNQAENRPVSKIMEGLHQFEKNQSPETRHVVQGHNQEEGQDDKQTGGTATEPCL